MSISERTFETLAGSWSICVSLTQNGEGGYITLCSPIAVGQQAQVLSRVLHPLTLKLEGSIVAADVHSGGEVQREPVFNPGDVRERSSVQFAGDGEGDVGEECGIGWVASYRWRIWEGLY